MPKACIETTTSWAILVNATTMLLIPCFELFSKELRSLISQVGFNHTNGMGYSLIKLSSTIIFDNMWAARERGHTVLTGVAGLIGRKYNDGPDRTRIRLEIVSNIHSAKMVKKSDQRSTCISSITFHVVGSSAVLGWLGPMTSTI